MLWTFKDAFQYPNIHIINSHCWVEFPRGGHTCCRKNKLPSLSPAVIMHKPQRIYLGVLQPIPVAGLLISSFGGEMRCCMILFLTRKPTLTVKAQRHLTSSSYLLLLSITARTNTSSESFLPSQYAKYMLPVPITLAQFMSFLSPGFGISSGVSQVTLKLN